LRIFGCGMFYQLDDRRVETQGDYFLAPGAQVAGSVVLGHNVSVWFNAVIRGDVEPITVGAFSNIQDCCVLHTDEGFPLTIGEHVTVGHQAMLHGCEVGDHTLIGISAVVLSGAKIGKNCLIGANSLVTEGTQIPDNSMVLGSPGKVVREVSEANLAGMRSSTQGYVARAAWYRDKFHPQGRGS
tara:strand:+ start:754 stop:1305 length:552 start_codon:yes stop_codon:yes gene_type:complete